MTRYTVGFAFDPRKYPSNPGVVLIRKLRPKWQAGRLNGIGGHIEPTDKDAYHAQSREFLEETGMLITPERWTHHATMHGEDWAVEVLSTQLGPEDDQPATQTDERVNVYPLDYVQGGNDELLDNLPWLVNICLDKDLAGRVLDIKYP